MKLEQRAVQRDLLKRKWIDSPDDLVHVYLGHADLQAIRVFSSKTTKARLRTVRLPGSALASLVLTRQSLLLFHASSGAWEWRADLNDVAVPDLDGATLDLVFVSDPPPRWQFTLTAPAEAAPALASINLLRSARLSLMSLEERVNQEACQADALWRLEERQRVVTGYRDIADSGGEPYAGAANLRIGSELRRQHDFTGAEMHLLRAEQTGRDDIAAAAASMLGLVALQRRDTATARKWAQRADQVPSATSQGLWTAIEEIEQIRRREASKRDNGPK